MAQQVEMLRVMIASPGDVAHERQIVRNVVHEWNATHAEARSIVLLPVGWETDSYPEMGDRAQALISNQILGACDLLVGIFWTRLGTPTGAALSGTVEEIEDHMAAGKPALLYFSSVPVELDSVDPSGYAALKQFRAECMQRGLVQQYDSHSAFQQLFQRHLAQTINRFFADATDEPRSDGTLREAQPQLSRDAQVLLQDAARTSDGVIVKLETIAGVSIEIAGSSFIREGDHRSEAQWRSALNELQDARLVEDRTGKGELFFLTHRGYELAGTLGG